MSPPVPRWRVGGFVACRIEEGTGKKLEPMEEVVCEVEDEHAGGVIESINNRKGEVRRYTVLVY